MHLIHDHLIELTDVFLPLLYRCVLLPLLYRCVFLPLLYRCVCSCSLSRCVSSSSLLRRVSSSSLPMCFLLRYGCDVHVMWWLRVCMCLFVCTAAAWGARPENGGGWRNAKWGAWWGRGGGIQTRFDVVQTRGTFETYAAIFFNTHTPLTAGWNPSKKKFLPRGSVPANRSINARSDSLNRN